jgi:hypothetical protein
MKSAPPRELSTPGGLGPWSIFIRGWQQGEWLHAAEVQARTWFDARAVARRIFWMLDPSQLKAQRAIPPAATRRKA